MKKLCGNITLIFMLFRVYVESEAVGNYPVCTNVRLARRLFFVLKIVYVILFCLKL